MITVDERAEIGDLRAEIAELREQLMLRDHALNATSTFFLVCKIALPECIVVYCNKAVAEVQGSLIARLIGRPIDELSRWIPPTSLDLSEVLASLQAGQPYRYENKLLRSDGTEFWLGATFMPLCNPSGRLTHAVAIGADITAKREEALKKQAMQDELLAGMRERERMGTQLQTAQKLESVGRLAAGIAHEINTPTQFIGNNVDFIKQSVADVFEFARNIAAAAAERPTAATLPAQILEAAKALDLDYLDEEIPKAIAQTEEGIERIKTIVGAMKEFSHPSAEKTSVDINRAINSTIIVASNEWKYVAELQTDLEPNLPAVFAVEGMFNQVILNLIVNAAHAIADKLESQAARKGIILISTRSVDDSIEVRVRDTGGGIPQAIRDRIFDPFFTTKPLGKGTGQGLAIAHDAIVDKHGGTIAVESQVGEGTTFVVRLPRRGPA